MHLNLLVRSRLQVRPRTVSPDCGLDHLPTSMKFHNKTQWTYLGPYAAGVLGSSRAVLPGGVILFLFLDRPRLLVWKDRVISCLFPAQKMKYFS